jgi:hypothetical protein
VYRFLTQECPDRIPEVVKRLRAKHVVTAVAEQRAARELLSIHEAFSTEGHEILAFKGPALAAQAYSHLGWRQSGDLDILVRKCDLPRVASVLAARGYRPRRYRSGDVDFGFFGSFEDQFTRQDSPPIDLHLALLPRYFPFRPRQEELWRRAVAVELDGRQVRTLAPDDHLIFSIAHATKHGWGWAPLRAMCDIAALTATGLIDWERNEFEFERVKCARVLRLAALLAKTFAGAQVPNGVLERAVADERVMGLARQIARRLFPAPGLVPSIYCDWIVPLSVTESWGRRARYLIDRALRPTIEDWDAMPLPRSLFWMYYVTRPARLLVTHGRRFLRLRPSVLFNEQ